MLTALLLRPVHFRGKARLLHKLCPRTGLRKVNIFGYQIELDLQNYIERSIYLRIFEPHESSLVRHYLKPGMTVVDVGANVGYYSLMASSIIGKDGHVYAFEPSPHVVNKLRQTIQQNRINNVTVIESALGDEEGMKGIYIPTSLALHNHSPSMVKQSFDPTQIKITTLDSFLDRHDIQQVDFLKLDVEGFEPDVIRGAREALIAGRVKAILCEFNEPWLLRNQSSSSLLFASLTSFGFRPSGCAFQEATPLQNLLLLKEAD